MAEEQKPKKIRAKILNGSTPLKGEITVPSKGVKSGKEGPEIVETRVRIHPIDKNGTYELDPDQIAMLVAGGAFRIITPSGEAGGPRPGSRVLVGPDGQPETVVERSERNRRAETSAADQAFAELGGRGPVPGTSGGTKELEAKDKQIADLQAQVEQAADPTVQREDESDKEYADRMADLEKKAKKAQK